MVAVTISGDPIWFQVAVAVGGFATVVVAGFALLAWRQAHSALREARHAREDALRPALVPHYLGIEKDHLRLTVENVGAGPALSVRVDLDAVGALTDPEGFIGPRAYPAVKAASGKIDLHVSFPTDQADPLYDLDTFLNEPHPLRLDYRDVYGNLFATTAEWMPDSFIGIRLLAREDAVAGQDSA